MFKRSAALILALLYTATVFGFGLNLHYCNSKISSVKINAPAKSCKMLQGKSKKMKCCKDKHVDVKVKDAHQNESPSFLGKIFAFELPKLPLEDFFLSAQKALIEKLFDNTPSAPPPGKISTFIKNCIFRL